MKKKLMYRLNIINIFGIGSALKISLINLFNEMEHLIDHSLFKIVEINFNGFVLTVLSSLYNFGYTIRSHHTILLGIFAVCYTLKFDQKMLKKNYKMRI